MRLDRPRGSPCGFAEKRRRIAGAYPERRACRIFLVTSSGIFQAVVMYGYAARGTASHYARREKNSA